MRALKILVGIFAVIGCLAIAFGGYYVYDRLRHGELKLRSPLRVAQDGQTTATAQATPMTSSDAQNASILSDYQRTRATPPPPPAAGPATGRSPIAAAVGTPPPPSAAAQLAAKPVRTPDASLKLVREWPTGRKWVSLTFDDGPHPEWTPKFIDLLRAKNVKATFFLLGQQIEKSPEIAKLLVDNGFEVANHTTNHPQFRSASKEKIREELTRTNELIKEATGIAHVTLMRPPYGQAPKNVQEVCDELGLKIITWNIDTDDWRSSTGEDKMTSNVMSNLKDGSIILMHDRSEKAYNTTLNIIDQIREKGYEFVTVSELLGWQPHTPPGGATAEGAAGGTRQEPQMAPGGAIEENESAAGSSAASSQAITEPAAEGRAVQELPEPPRSNVITTPPPRRR